MQSSGHCCREFALTRLHEVLDGSDETGQGWWSTP